MVSKVGFWWRWAGQAAVDLDVCGAKQAAFCYLGSFVLVCGSDSVTGQLTFGISLNR